MVADSAGLGNRGLRAKGMSGSGPSFHYGVRLNLAACCRIGLPITDTQHKNRRAVGNGRLLPRSCRSRASAIGQTDQDPNSASIGHEWGRALFAPAPVAAARST